MLMSTNLSSLSQASRIFSGGSTNGLRARREGRVDRRQSCNPHPSRGCSSGKRKSCELQLPECQAAKRIVEEDSVVYEAQSEATPRACHPITKHVIEEDSVADGAQSEATSRACYPALLAEGAEVQQQQQLSCQQQSCQRQVQQQQRQEWFVRASYALACAQQQCQSWMLVHHPMYSSSLQQQQCPSWMLAHRPLYSFLNSQQQRQQQQPAALPSNPTNPRAVPLLPPQQQQQQHNQHQHCLHHYQQEQRATPAPNDPVGSPTKTKGAAGSAEEGAFAMSASLQSPRLVEAALQAPVAGKDGTAPSHPTHPVAMSLGINRDCSLANHSDHCSRQAIEGIHGIRLAFGSWGHGSSLADNSKANINTHSSNSSGSLANNDVHNKGSSSWHSVADVPARLQCAKRIAQAVAHNIRERGLQHALGRALILALVHSTEVALYSSAPSLAAYTAPATLQARVAAVLGQLIAEATSHCAAPSRAHTTETAQGVVAPGASAGAAVL
uniref:Uncharacterized protein n=1 Tax=Dunaliella tertiolecta TaxID=3047 RepID=A0A7S3QQU5_DUNTE